MLLKGNKGENMGKWKYIIILLSVFILGASTLASAFTFPFKSSKSDGVYFGLFREGAPREMYKIDRFEKEYGLKPHFVMWYLDWKQPFSMEQCLKVLEYGAIPHIVWEPWVWGEFDAIRLKNIINGDWDNYITTFARDVKRFEYPVFLRILHEFNIEGYSWSLSVNDKDYDRYIKAYRHIVDIFRREGAYNAFFIWCPMNYSYPNEPWNDYTKAYPGDDYVDWIGIDGYNWGTVQAWSQWQSFEILFREPVRILSRKYPTKPIMIAEFASSTEGGDKVKWVEEIPYYLKTTLKPVKCINWFDIKKEADWRIKSPPEAVPAFKKMVKDQIFQQAKLDNITTLKVNYTANIKKKTIDIHSLKSPRQITASLEGWSDRNFVKIQGLDSVSSGGINWTGDNDLSARAQFAWDSHYFYCVFDITDDMPLNNKHTNGDIWNGDGVELCLSIDPDADKNRTSFTETDFQIGFGSGDYINIKPSIWIFGKNKSPKDAEIKVKPTKKGYVLEVKLAWKELGYFVPKKGQKIGFTFAIDDADKDGNRESQILFSGDYLFYKDPSVWGEAVFK